MWDSIRSDQIRSARQAGSLARQYAPISNTKTLKHWPLLPHGPRRGPAGPRDEASCFIVDGKPCISLLVAKKAVFPRKLPTQESWSERFLILGRAWVGTGGDGDGIGSDDSDSPRLWGTNVRFGRFLINNMREMGGVSDEMIMNT